MSNLLKADLYALLKNKMTYILLGICAGLSLLTVGIYYGLSEMFDALVAEEEDVIMGMTTLVNARSVIFSNFSLTNNGGLIIPIFAGLIVMTDIRCGTVRNKVIFGKSRVQIYFSHLIVATLLCLAATLLSLAVMAGGSLLLFDYGVPFDGEEAANLTRCLTAGIMTFVYVASVATFFALVTKSTPLTVILTMAVCLGLGLLCSLLSLVPNHDYDTLIRLIPTNVATTVTSYGTLSVEEFAMGVGSYLFFIAANTVAGILIFKKADLK
ncbi:MAG: hypothetical protein J6X61_03475 [Clostridia bacterium]|nr:hypothetical protein [Clostridia bacterium]